MRLNRHIKNNFSASLNYNIINNRDEKGYVFSAWFEIDIKINERLKSSLIKYITLCTL